LDGSECFGRPDGVLFPLDEAPDGSLDSVFKEASSLAFAFASSSFFLSISACFSSSDVSSSLCRC